MSQYKQMILSVFKKVGSKYFMAHVGYSTLSFKKVSQDMQIDKLRTFRVDPVTGDVSEVKGN